MTGGSSHEIRIHNDDYIFLILKQHIACGTFQRFKLTKFSSFFFFYLGYEENINSTVLYGLLYCM
jgi:hypothetical protein